MNWSTILVFALLTYFFGAWAALGILAVTAVVATLLVAILDKPKGIAK